MQGFSLDKFTGLLRRPDGLLAMTKEVMPKPLLARVKQRAEKLAYNTVLYNWTLGGEAPERLLVKPVDMWPGDAEEGHPDLFGNNWEPEGVEPSWIEATHGFTWLRNLRSIGDSSSRQQGRNMIESWVRRYYSWDRASWRPDIAGTRVSMWISHYDYFGAGGDEVFQDLFFESLARQARHLARSLPGDMHGVALLRGAKGLLYCGLALEGREALIEQALTIFEKESTRQILSDGAHVSRSPADLLEALQIYLDVRTALNAGGYPAAEKIQHSIDRMAPALKFFMHGDQRLSLFNGAQEGSDAVVEAALSQAQGGRGKGLQSLPCAGFERLALGKSFVIVDAGKAPSYPYDLRAHAAPLSFEFSYGKERLFVNCGSHPGSSDWREALRATPAHNTLTLDHRNACEIRADGHFGRRVRAALCVREDSKDACLVDVSHDGYMALNGITHRRRLFLSQGGEDLRGEDMLNCSTGLMHPEELAIRFHIHPRVMVSLVQEGSEALLRMPGGTGWRFHQAGGMMKLEDSIYLGEGTRPRKTKQIVIYARMEEDQAQIKWALHKEG